MTGRLVATFGLLWILPVVAIAMDTLPDRIEFNRDIRPILSDNCFTCHGPDQNHREADLRLDTEEGLRAKAGETPTIVAGKPEESELFRRLVTDDPDQKMPATGSGKGLSDRQIALVKRWIEQGAPWEGHWAYIPPKRPPVPQVENSVFLKGDIDRFLLRTMQKNHVNPSVEADRVTLIRRLSFDLLGLPPSWKDVEAFVQDKSPDAYEKLVDRLLASPHFGERMAMWWMDLVRFADSIGYHSDNPMSISPYRDYVIAAFNANKPFSEFTTEQLAGDLLPDATIAQRVASGYNRLLMTTEEGGAQPKEYEQKYAADRVRNFSSVWLGATMACAQCHDHKFDPYTMRDFYSMAAFFADVEEASVGRREAGMPVPNEEQQKELAKLDASIERYRTALHAPVPQLAAAQAEWERQISADVTWKVVPPKSATATSGNALKWETDGVVSHIGNAAAQDDFSLVVVPELDTLSGIRLEVLSSEALPARGPGTASNGNFVLSEIVVEVTEPGKNPEKLSLSEQAADFSQDTFPIRDATDGKMETGWAVLPQTGRDHVATFALATPRKLPAGSELTVKLVHQSPHAHHQIGRLRLAVTDQLYPLGKYGLPQLVQNALAVPADQRTSEQAEAIAAHYRSITPLLAPIRGLISVAESKRNAIIAGAPKSLVSTSGPPRTVRILPRGNWLDESGPIVEPAVPEFLSPSSHASPRASRLDLANWLLSPDNPLTARVVVNRFWKLYFGYGLARTLEDLGSQGEWPTHPELLDYLAVDFRESGWDVKRMVRSIVTSGAYRQTSLVSEELKEKDPYNRLFARQSRFRLDAEIVRDNALAVSGLLVRTVGGPSVKPYQPAGYWSALNFPPREWKNDDGPALYRRGMYTHWQRSFLHPSLLAFDAPSREECTVDRPRSNIPQQALVLLNDPTYVEAARVLAERLLKQGGTEPAGRISFAYREVLSRSPSDEERQVLVSLQEKHLEQYRGDLEAAKALLATGKHPTPAPMDPAELAAWTSVARVLLNLHETITRN